MSAGTPAAAASGAADSMQGNVPESSGGILLIVASASLFSYCCTLFGISQASQALLAAVGSNKWVFLLIVNVIFLIAGCFIDANSAMYIFIPIMAPVAQQLGYSLIAFGVLATVNLAIGQVTPPVGVNLFVAMGLKVKEAASGVREKTSEFVSVTLPQISRAVTPMVCACLAVLVVVTAFPQVSLAFIRGKMITAALRTRSPRMATPTMTMRIPTITTPRRTRRYIPGRIPGRR